MTTLTLTTSGSWDAAASSVDLAAWGEGDNGNGGTTSRSGNGGTAGAYAEEPALALTTGTSYPYTIGQGGSAVNTVFAGNSVTVTAESGTNGGAAGSNTIAYSGGAGGSGLSGSAHEAGGGGGGAAGNTGNGGAGGGGGVSGGAGGTGNDGGGDGGTGGGAEGAADPGIAPGGGGGGGGKTDESGHPGADGAAGQITITYYATVDQTAVLSGSGSIAATGYIGGFASLAGSGTIFAQRAGFSNAALAGVGSIAASAILRAGASLSGLGTITAEGGTPAPAIVNAWANNYGQGTTFTSITSALQSCVVPLTQASTILPGSGVPSEGNWLFTISSWSQDPQIINVHVGVSDDIHSYWRQYPAGGSGGYSRTSIAYTPNLARSATTVYVAPDMEISAINVVVLEIEGLGNWDTVTGTNSDYAAGATSLGLSLAAPPQAAFLIGAIGGDNASSGQAFAPSGWTTVPVQTQSNGVNTLADNILNVAVLPSTLSSASVTGTASTAENMSGFLLGVEVNAASPIPAGQNPAWPFLKFEAAFGGGYNTPVSELTWTDLTSRLWDWDETTGVQYQLGELQATNLTLTLDNYDAYLSPDNTSSPYYPHVVPGTPIRIRAALGTMAGQAVNRWYILQRNAAEWDEEIDEAFRRYCTVTGTDLWAALSSVPPTFYRSEVYEDGPYAWWPMDDQPLTSGVQPVTLANAAFGNSAVLEILLSPNGAQDQPFYTQSGAANAYVPGGLASYQVGQNEGWMFGDPQGTSPTLDTGSPVTSIPGSASWTVQGQAGEGGGYGWYLSCTDSGFPAISGGITVEIWFNYAYYGTATGAVTSSGGGTVTTSPVAGQPVSTAFTIWALGTSTSTTASLQLDASGYLDFILGGTSHPVYTGSDLRSNSWHMATVTITSTAWAVWLDGGSNAQVSGTGSPSSSWSVFTVAAVPGGLGGCGNASFAHAAVYPVVLPYYRILDHYWSAITAFGQLPAPQAPKVTWTGLPQIAQSTSYNSPPVQVYNPDGTPPFTWSGSNGEDDTGTATASPASASLVVAASVPAAGVTSGPSAVATGTDAGQFVVSTVDYPQYFLPWYSWAGLAPQFDVYTASGGSGQTLYATVNGTGTGPGGSSNVGGSASGTPPSATAIGDTVGQRIERLMRGGRCTSPQRSIDPSPLLVQAPGNQGGGIQVGASIQEQQQSDNGLLFIDNCGNLVYWMRSHLAGQYSSPVWQIGPATGSSQIPYYREIKWKTDPQRIWNAITIAPFSPTGAELPLIVPQNASAVLASQIQYGAQPLQVISWLQDQSEMTAQADWLFENFGSPIRRAEEVKIDAAPYSPAWQLVLGINVGDVVALADWQIGAGGNVYTYRVSRIKRRLSYGTHDSEVTASVELQADWEPPSYWE